jgi:hypothetical protein
MPERKSHMVALPRGFLVLRIFQLVFATIVAGVCIFGVIYAVLPSFILNIFTGICTIITLIYIFVATYGSSNLYQYWAILSLEIFCLISWLASFTYLASNVAIASANNHGYDRNDRIVIAIFGSCAGVGAVEFVLFIISLSMYSVAIHRHHKAGSHCVPGSAWPVSQFKNPNQYVGSGKIEMQPQYVVVPVQQTSHQYQEAPQQVPMQPVGSPQPYQAQPMPQQYQQQQYQQQQY